MNGWRYEEGNGEILGGEGGERAQYPYTNSQSSQVYMGHMMYIILLQLVTACSLFYIMF